MESRVTPKTFHINDWRHPRSPKPLEHQDFPYRFDSLLQVAVDLESFLEAADNRISGAQCEMFRGRPLSAPSKATKKQTENSHAKPQRRKEKTDS